MNSIARGIIKSNRKPVEMNVYFRPNASGSSMGAFWACGQSENGNLVSVCGFCPNDPTVIQAPIKEITHHRPNADRFSLVIDKQKEGFAYIQKTFYLIERQGEAMIAASTLLRESDYDRGLPRDEVQAGEPRDEVQAGEAVAAPEITVAATQGWWFG